MRRIYRKTRRKKVSKENKVNSCGREAYLYSKKKIGFKRDDVNNWPGYCKIVNTIFDTIAYHVVNNKEGVFIKGLGYFGVLLYQPTSKGVRSTNGKDIEYLINSHTDGAVFCLNFVPIADRKPLGIETFIMDGTFSKGVERAFSKKLMEGFKYKNNAPLFYRI